MVVQYSVICAQLACYIICSEFFFFFLTSSLFCRRFLPKICNLTLLSPCLTNIYYFFFSLVAMLVRISVTVCNLWFLLTAKKPQQPPWNLKLKLTKITFPTLFFNLSKITTNQAIPLTSVMHFFVIIIRRHLS